jgi:predicted nucleic acid-binding protein
MLATTDRVVDEARRRVSLGLKRPDLLNLLDELARTITVVPVSSLEPLREEGERTLKDAVASRNGSTRDAHVLALAWSVGGDVWTTDRDFAGTGVATWSTPNLMRALAETE